MDKTFVPGVLVTVFLSLHGFVNAADAPPKQLIERLGAENFKERQDAQEGLMAWGREEPEAARRWLYDRMAAETDPEIRRRCTAALRELVLETYRHDGEGYIGITMNPVNIAVPGDVRIRFGVNVTAVMPGSPAAKSNLQIGVVIVGANDQTWHDENVLANFQKWIRDQKPGSKITLEILRDGKLVQLPLTLERRPQDADVPGLFEERPNLGPLKQEREDAYFESWLQKQKQAK